MALRYSKVELLNFSAIILNGKIFYSVIGYLREKERVTKALHSEEGSRVFVANEIYITTCNVGVPVRSVKLDDSHTGTQSTVP